MERHHHFIEEATGQVYDIPVGAVEILGHEELDRFDVTDYQVIMRGRLKQPTG
jgi:Fe2+ or Zn2+ uptake regulation protein